jgi:hypothetical protein
MASATNRGMLSAEERRRQRELEEARKAGLAPAEVRMTAAAPRLLPPVSRAGALCFRCGSFRPSHPPVLTLRSLRPYA